MFAPVAGVPRRLLTSVVRVLLAGLLLAGGLVFAVAVPSYACSCAVLDAAALADNADQIFTGRVDKVRQSDRQLVHSVTATRSFKGEVTSEMKVSTAEGAAACGLGKIRTGTDFVFFTTGQDSPYRTNVCSGSGPLTDKRLAALTEQFGEGIVVPSSEAPTPTMTKVEESPPRRMSRLAAPGAALALLGLLGLVVVAWRRR